MKPHFSTCAIALCTACLLNTMIEQARGANFVGLGDLPGGNFFSRAYGISSDGSVIVGQSNSASGNEAFRWTGSTGMVGLGDFAGGDFDSAAYGVSANGSVIVGVGTVASSATYSTGMGRAFQWTANTGMFGLGVGESVARSISSDGSVIAGLFNSSSYGTQPVCWTSGSMSILTNFLVSGGDALAVSADGSVIVGETNYAGYQEGYRWTNSDGMFGLGANTSATGVSADGSVIVGYGTSALGTEAFRWTSDEGRVGLGYLSGTTFYSRAAGVSANGSVIVGVSSSDSGNAAFIWDATNGMRNLRDVLSPSVGAALDGWTLINATAISADGLTVVGYGTNPNGNGEAWLANLSGSVPEPATCLLFDIGLAAAVAWRPSRRLC